MSNIPYISVSHSDSSSSPPGLAPQLTQYYPPSPYPTRYSNFYSHIPPGLRPSERTWNFWIKIAPVLCGAILILVLFAVWQIGPLPENSDEKWSTNLNYDGGCNPFEEPGYINFDPNHYLNNTWKTYTPDCQPDNLMKQLVDDLQRYSRGRDRTSARVLPWLQNRTVLLIGDSLERFHLRDFCDLLSASIEPPFHPVSDVGRSLSPSTPDSPSQSFHIKPDLPLSPKPYYYDPNDHSRAPDDWPNDKRADFAKKQEEWAKRDNVRTKPWVCEVPAYGFRLVSLFTYGLEPYQSGYFYSNDDWYIPPSSFLNRVDQILLPLIQNLAAARHAPQILKPDLLEVCSGLWDLRQWTEADSRAMGQNLDDSSEVPFQTLTGERLNWWKQRSTAMLQGIAARFPEDDVPILWRTLHHPLRHNLAPYSRVEQLDQLARSMVAGLQRRPGPLANRLKLDNWGRMMLGQENHFRDSVHPRAAPGSVLWGEMMLWELRRTVMIKEKATKLKNRS
ncbi:hypothetical protein CROQUDRAFT_653283 [Cronartium quercuum f. sp. fusiforme G11]|uniref:Uncharacterized protein n=1 Tax=Cronartium quercuum f. sp. fusiforme G11 TaxID=708437 RepID=A0A9P6NMA0_9BASI|nr:hypothetical protein CROQUDRAFT_653283 [Cronartium quercuum f. sp. fusiforme G11]